MRKNITKPDRRLKKKNKKKQKGKAKSYPQLPTRPPIAEFKCKSLIDKPRRWPREHERNRGENDLTCHEPWLVDTTKETPISYISFFNPLSSRQSTLNHLRPRCLPRCFLLKDVCMFGEMRTTLVDSTFRKAPSRQTPQASYAGKKTRLNSLETCVTAKYDKLTRGS